MTPDELKALIDGIVMDDAEEMLNHSPWVVLRWRESEDPKVTDPEAHGPFVTPAEAFTCADTLARQHAEATRRNIMAREANRSLGMFVTKIVPLFSDYNEGSILDT